MSSSEIQSAYDLLQLDATYNIDLDALDRTYFQLQSQFHPDRFIGLSPEERAQVEQRSAEINQAYEALKDPLKRVQNLILHRGLTLPLREGETLKDPETLMEAMALQEELEALVTPDQFKAFRLRIAQKFEALVVELIPFLEEGNQEAIHRLYPRLAYMWKRHEEARALNRAAILKVF